MTIFTSTTPLLFAPPEDKTVAQFFLDCERPVPKEGLNLPEYPCLIEEKTGRRIYLEEIRRRTDFLARALQARWKLGVGDVVAFCTRNHPDTIVCEMASHRIGAIAAPMSASLTKDEFVHLLNLTKPKLLIVHVKNFSIALEAASRTDLEMTRIVVISSTVPTVISLECLIAEGEKLPLYVEVPLCPGENKTRIAYLVFSSGTSGLPKAVCISHYNIISNALQVATSHGIFEPHTHWDQRHWRPGDLVSGVLPLNHIYGLTLLHSIIYSRMTLVLSETFDLRQWLDSISRYRITHLPMVPPQVVLLCKHPSAKTADLSSVRYCIIGAAPLSEELQQQLLDRLPNIYIGQGYGMSEAGCIATFPATQKAATLGSAGQLVSGTLAKVVKADGTLAKPGEVGELHLKGGQIAVGYYNNMKASEETFVDGWLHTGDVVAIHSNGDVFVHDRLKEIIKVKGHQVAPAELEGHLLDHPDIVDAGVIGTPDAYAGEVPTAFVVLRPELMIDLKNNKIAASEWQRKVAKHVSDHKSKDKWIAGGVYFVDTIPKSPSGKILRRELRKRYQASFGPAASKL